jgi:hypothetical protein
MNTYSESDMTEECYHPIPSPTIQIGRLEGWKAGRRKGRKEGRLGKKGRREGDGKA